MLTLTHNGHEIPLRKDFSCRLSWKNPACFFNEIPGSAAMGIEIPVTDYAVAIFGSPHRFEKYGNGADRKFADVDLRFKGVLLLNGTLNITNATSDSYSAWLQQKVGVVGEEQREKYISDLDWSDFENIHFQDKNYFDDTVDDYCTGQIVNRRFWEGTGKMVKEDEEFTNDEGEKDTREILIEELTASFRNNYEYEVNSSVSGLVRYDQEGAVVSPFLFLRFVLRQVLRKVGFFIDDSRNFFQGNKAWSNLCMYNNYNIMRPEFVTETKYWYKKDPDTGKDVIYNAELITSIAWQIREFNYKNLLPKVKIAELLLGLQNWLNIVFVFDNFGKVGIIDRESILENDSIDLDSYFCGKWTIGERKNLSLKFVSEYDKDDSLLADKYHELSDRRENFAEPIASVYDLEYLSSPEIGEIRHCEWEDEYHEWKWEVVEEYDDINQRYYENKLGWVFASSGPQPEWVGSGETVEEIKTILSTLYMHWKVGGLAVSQKGTFYYQKSLWNNFSPRLIFYCGQDGLDITSKEAEGTTGTVCLRLYGENGLLKKRWKRWNEFWINRLPVEGEFDLPLNVIIMVLNNLTSKFRTVNGEFMIEELEVEFGIELIGRAKIKGYKV